MRPVMRYVWRLWLRSGSARSLFIFIFIVLFTLHVISLSTRREEGEGEEEEEEGVPVDPVEIEKKDLERRDLPPRLPSPEDHALGVHADWVEAAGSGREVFLYSAYLDRRKGGNFVRLVAITKKRKKVEKCRVWAGDKSLDTPASVKLIHENWNLPYIASFVLCKLPDSLRPTQVTLLPYAQVILPVQDLEGRGRIGNMAVCVKPIHYQYDRAVWLVEFVEFYRLLGADQFVLYNHTMGPNLEAVVRYYQEKGIVTVLPWTLPVITQKEIRTEGIFAALNDCNLRVIGRYTYAAMVDFDEFLIPRQHDNLLDLLNSFQTFNVYIFQNVFFYLYWENDTAVHDALFPDESGIGNALFGSEAAMPYLLTAFKTRRLNNPHPHGKRSKYVVRPERVIELGNHGVWEHVGKKSLKNVPKTMGLSHHYRICEYGGFDCLKISNHVDRMAHAWLIPLAKSVSAACQQMFPQDGACPVAPPLGSPW